MRSHVALAALLVAIGFVASPAYSRPKVSKASTQPVLGEPFAADMAKLTAVVELTEAQQKQIEQRKVERDESVAKWDAANQKKMTAIREKMAKLSSKSRSRAALDRQLKLLEGGRSRLLALHARNIFGVLNRQQRGKWNGPLLAEAVLKEFRAQKLQPDQVKKVHEICQKRGEGVIAPVDAKRHEVTFKGVKQQAYATVLTPTQRREYTAAKKPTPRTSRQRTKTSSKRKR